MDDELFLTQLNKHPALKKRMEAILSVSEDLTGILALADDAEDALIEHGRALNREALQAWAHNKASQSTQQFEKKHKKANKDVKKNSVGTAPSETSK